MRRRNRFTLWKPMPLLALLALLFIFSGCQAGTAEETWVHPEADQTAMTYVTSGPELSSREPAAEKHRIVLGFSQLGSESDWRNANSQSIKTAAKEAGIELLFENAEQSQEKQFEAVRSFISRKVDVIAIAPVIQTGWVPILDEAEEAGIPVIIVDRAVDASNYVTLIGSDLYEEGKKAGKFLLDKMVGHPGPIQIVELKGTEGSTPSIDRGRGFADTVLGDKRFKVLESEHADFTLEQGRRSCALFAETRWRDGCAVRS